MSNQLFKLAIQLPFSIDSNFYQDEQLKKIFLKLKEEGFTGVELNITDYDEINPNELQDFLGEYNLRMTMIATGAYAKKNTLSLSDDNEANRVRTVDELKKIIAFAEKTGAGVICGFIKGTANNNYEKACEQLKKSLIEIGEYGYHNVDIYLEATNHYESTVVKKIEEAGKILRNMPKWFKVLPDTYHMNIEESSMEAEILNIVGQISDFHISDNNRRFPGYGVLDFFRIINFLYKAGYQGVLCIEGNVSDDIMEDITQTSSYIQSVFKKISLVN